MDIPDTDAAYYRMRERHERDLASNAAVDDARIAHQILADKYGSLAEQAEQGARGSADEAAPGGPFASPV